MLQHAAVGVLRRDHLLSTSRARQHSGLSSQVTCFLLGKGAPNAHAFLWWYSFFGTVTLCKGVPQIHWKAQDGEIMSYGTETFDLRESRQ